MRCLRLAKGGLAPWPESSSSCSTVPATRSAPTCRTSSNSTSAWSRRDKIVYYDRGVGTIGKPGWWDQLKLKSPEVIGLALGYGLDDNVLGAYSWLCSNWREGDCIYLLGFSRGAYTARVLAGFIHMCGLLRPEQLNLCGYAIVAYKSSADDNDLEIGYNFRRISGARRPRIRFVGVWDTVSTVIVPRADRFYLPSLQTLPFTRTTPRRTFRHAMRWTKRRDVPLTTGRTEARFPRAETRGSERSRTGRRSPLRNRGAAILSAEAPLHISLLWMILQAQELPKTRRFASTSAGRLSRPGSADGRRSQYPYVGRPESELHESLTGPGGCLSLCPRAPASGLPGRLGFLGLTSLAEPWTIPTGSWKKRDLDEPLRRSPPPPPSPRSPKSVGYRPGNLPPSSRSI